MPKMGWKDGPSSCRCWKGQEKSVSMLPCRLVGTVVTDCDDAATSPHGSLSMESSCSCDMLGRGRHIVKVLGSLCSVYGSSG